MLNVAKLIELLSDYEPTLPAHEALEDLGDAFAFPIEDLGSPSFGVPPAGGAAVESESAERPSAVCHCPECDPAFLA